MANFFQIMKEVLKENDFSKIEDIAEYIDINGSITPAVAKSICNKSDTTVWRYLNIMTKTGFVIAEGETNNKTYRRI